MKDYRNAVKELESQLKELKVSLKDAEKQTATFLKKCSEFGIEKVSIGKHPGESWPFGGAGNVFTFSDERTPKTKGHSAGWPAIWGVVEELGISTGCGNTDQHNVGKGENLMEGIYQMKNGKWTRRD